MGNIHIYIKTWILLNGWMPNNANQINSPMLPKQTSTLLWCPWSVWDSFRVSRKNLCSFPGPVSEHAMDLLRRRWAKRPDRVHGDICECEQARSDTMMTKRSLLRRPPPKSEMLQWLPKAPAWSRRLSRGTCRRCRFWFSCNLKLCRYDRWCRSVYLRLWNSETRRISWVTPWKKREYLT